MRKHPFRPTARLVAVILLAVCFSAGAYARDDISPWLADEYSRAELYGLVPAIIQDEDMRRPITRREFCHVALLLYEAFGGSYQETVVNSFSDCRDSLVMSAYSLGIVTGYDDGSFQPDRAITRQEIFKLLYNLLTIQGYNAEISHNEALAALEKYDDSPLIQEWAAIPACVLIQAQVTNGISDTILAPTGTTTREQAVVLTYRLYNAIADGRLSCPDPVGYESVPVDEPMDESYGGAALSGAGGDAGPVSAGLTYEEKYIKVFGSLDAPLYQTEEEALSNMVEITVPVWNYNTAGIKVSTSRSLLVHKNIAETVMLIFQDIYNGDERFPIYSVGGYSWRGDGTSEHNWGIAIDINPDENMMIRGDTILAGQLWEPGVNKYSIPENGDVVRAFAKYGFAWGGNAWMSNNDYMHFSFFGH